MTLEWVVWPLIALVLIAAVALEFSGRSVPWALPVGGLALVSIARASIEGTGSLDNGLVTSVLGALVCGGPFALLALSSSKVGKTDAWLAAASGSALGLERALFAVMFIAVAGAVVAVLALIWQRVRRVKASVDRPRAIPYGLPIALGTWWAVAWVTPVTFEAAPAPIEVVSDATDGGDTISW